jgi:dipeptidyl aminopeptidase/acylaminoacyl peptidase
MVYHGDCDTTVPITESINMLTAVNKRGGNAQIKVLYGVAHNAWDEAYAGDELYNWLLSHKRGENNE